MGNAGGQRYRTSEPKKAEDTEGFRQKANPRPVTCNPEHTTPIFHYSNIPEYFLWLSLMSLTPARRDRLSLEEQVYSN